jgi:hypothetical protein
MNEDLSLPSPEEPRKRWLNIDFDLVETVRCAVVKVRGDQVGAIA